VWLNVSLDGATSDTNDLIRGKGTFNNVIEKLRILSKHTQFTLAFTIMKSNLSEIQQCAEIAKTVGAHTAVFRPLYPVGTAQHHLDLMPSYEDYNEALNILQTIGEDSNFEFCNIDPFSPKTRQESQPNVYHNFGCGAGNLVCSISVSGDMNPCSFLGNSFVAGNVRENSFSHIWHNSQGFQNIRNLPGGNEQTFSGGCRARSLVFNGSINAPDPWIVEKEKLAGEQNQGNLQVSDRNIYHPMTILEIS
jgi:radical SAM protein with 4Fe4S-binding SPASM domain